MISGKAEEREACHAPLEVAVLAPRVGQEPAVRASRPGVDAAGEGEQVARPARLAQSRARTRLRARVLLTDPIIE